MSRIRLAYRDNDRTPFIFCVKEMAARHYDVDVEVLHIRGTEEYEAAIFEDAADIIVEHVEYLYAEAASGKRVTLFCAPVLRTEAELVVAPDVRQVSDLLGRKIVIRAQGRPHVTMLRLRAMGLEGQVETQIVPDADVGRWSQWKRVASGASAATFISDEYLPPAIDAGLTVLPAPDVPIVGHYPHACLSAFARANDELMRRYVAAVIHAICLMKYRPDEAMEIVSQEPRRRIGIEDERELRRRFDAIASRLELRPYPTIEAVANSYEVAIAEWPGGKGVNPLTLWDLHWVKQLDDEGFIDELVRRMT
ncbi:MAG: hypothetical protein GEU73_10540 [Chloroflexi bacterium]|nr:hypothetical protein [Chloroflexota bacterium]